MSGEQQQEHDQYPRADAVDQRRRRLTTAAVAAVPAFFILRHRTGMADSGASTGDSGTARAAPNCSGRSPGFWRNHPADWPASCEPGSPKLYAGGEQQDAETGAGYLAAAAALTEQRGVVFEGGTPFFDVAARGDHFHVRQPEGLTLMDVLHLRGEEDPQGMGAHFVAALLNARSGLTEPLPESKVREMWRQWVLRGYYSPPPGVDRWDAEDIKAYFKTTWA